MPRPSLFVTLRRRLRLGGDPASVASAAAEADPGADPLLEAGRHLRQAREAVGLSLRDLALDTRISTTVIEAIERGWRDRLPEEAYLRTMVPLLERRLHLAEGSLQAALPREEGDLPQTAGRLEQLRRFTPGSIDVFSSWQGTVLYGALTLGLIYAVNLQQERLANANLLTRQPISPLAIPTTPRPALDGTSLLLDSFPDLRPLSGTGPSLQLERLRQDDTLAFGRLQLALKQPSRVTISAEDGRQLTELQGASGTLALPLLPPLTVTIEPPPPPGAVLWNDTAVKAEGQARGQFRIGPRP